MACRSLLWTARRLFPLLTCCFALACATPGTPDYALLRPEAPLEAGAARGGVPSQSLNGAWRFKLQPPGGVELADAQFYLPQYDASGWREIQVPSHWELQGYEEPGRREPSRLSDVAASAGLYRREFTPPAAWRGRRIFLEFEGALWGCQAWVNGRLVGQDSSAYTPKRFDITQHVTPGAANLLAVRVTKLSPEMPFDADAAWALSGLFRDVRILARPEFHLTEPAVTTELTRGGTRALVTVEAGARRYAAAGAMAGCDILCELYDPAGARVASGTVDLAAASVEAPSSFERGGRAQLIVDRPRLWTAETPHLYRLELKLMHGGSLLDTQTHWVGLRQVRIVNQALQVNGRKVTLRGIDWHGLHPETGRALTEEQLRHDVRLLKLANANLVRIIDHPPDPEFLALCDRFGLYVICPMPVGGMAHSLVVEPYAAELRSRVEATIRMARLHPSVILWSPGGEPAWTPLVEATARLVRELDPSRPLLVALAVPSDREADLEFLQGPPLADVLALPYPVTEALGLLADECPRPVFFLRQPNEPAPDVEERLERWRTIEARADLAGGTAGTLADLDLKQLVVPLSPDAPLPRTAATGGVARPEGLMAADRQPKDAYWATRVVYSPIHVHESELITRPGRRRLTVTLSNHYDFLNLNRLRMRYGIERDGRALERETKIVTLAPHEHGAVRMRVDVPELTESVATRLMIQFVDAEDQVLYSRGVRLRDARW